MPAPAEPLFHPSASAEATAIAAAFNIIRPHKMAGIISTPDNPKADVMKKWAGLVGDCAQIIMQKANATST